MKVIETEYGTDIDILFNLSPYSARPMMVESEGVTAGSDGKKIVKAGSILNVSGVVVNDATARYVLLKDVDVTNGDAPGAGVYIGTLDIDKIETHTGVTISEDVKIALKGIFFMKDEDLTYNAGYGNDDNEALATRVTAVESSVDTLDTAVLTENTGLVDVVTKETTGLVARVTALETA